MGMIKNLINAVKTQKNAEYKQFGKQPARLTKEECAKIIFKNLKKIGK